MSDRGRARLRALIVEDEWPAREYLIELLLGSGEAGVTVGPGSRDPAAPLVLVLSRGSGSDRSPRSPALIDTGACPGARVKAVVACPIGSRPGSGPGRDRPVRARPRPEPARVLEE